MLRFTLQDFVKGFKYTHTHTLWKYKGFQVDTQTLGNVRYDFWFIDT